MARCGAQLLGFQRPLTTGLLVSWRRVPADLAGSCASPHFGECSLHHGTAPYATSASGPLPEPRNIWCIGRNYAEHARELGNDMPDSVPMVFLKAGSSIARPGVLHLPLWAGLVHHEVELALELGHDLQPVRGLVALDLTARTLQNELKAKSWPWTVAKSFPHSAPIGRPFSLEGIDPGRLQLTLDVNGKRRQHGHTADMLFPLPTLLQYIMHHFPARPGDLVLTGTPAGVSALRDGDVVVARVLSEDGSKVLSDGEWDVEQEEA